MLDQPEPYILTPDEETEVLRHHIVREQDLRRYKMRRAHFSEAQIELEISQVDWMQKIDRAAILKAANSEKNYQVWLHNKHEQERAEQKRQYEILSAEWTASRMYRLIKYNLKQYFGRDLIFNDDTAPLIKAVCMFLSRDERFKTELGLDMDKGLNIRGAAGRGKTTVIKCASDNAVRPVRVVSMIEINDTLRKYGEVKIMSLFGLGMLCLDDVGTEETTINYYGTKIQWFKDFVEDVYMRGLPFNRIIITTNLSYDQIEERYGFRVRSRMREMFNNIDVTGKDMRK